MAAYVYALCALLSMGCTWMLLKQYRRSRVAIVLWTLIGFFGVSLNNILLFIDLMIGPAYDLTMIRLFVSFFGLGISVSGLLWDSV
jgi:hypothetical protein